MTDQLIEELTAMLDTRRDTNQDGLTKWEIIEATGWPINKTHNILRKAAKDGIIEAIGGYRHSVILNRDCWTILYRVKGKVV